MKNYSTYQERMTIMSNVIKTIFDRYSCRDFTGSPITSDQAETLAKAALAAPSAMNMQPWHITVITNKELIDEMDADAMFILKAQGEEAYKRIMDRGGRIFYNAPCLIVIAKNEADYSTLDTGIAAQNIALAAHDLGLASVICGMARIPLSGSRAAEWAKHLQIPEGYVFGMAVCVGFAKSGKPPHELDFSKVIYIN